MKIRLKQTKNRSRKINKSKEKISRNSNFELLRIVSMLLIIFYHVTIRGGVLNNSRNNTFSVIIFILELTALVHVNSFVLLTGYFQSEKEFKMSKVWSLINSSLFYKITIMIFLVSFGYITVSKVDILRNLSIIPVDTHWFIRIYLPLYLFSPFINKLIKKLTQKEYLKLLGMMFIIMSVIPSFLGEQSFYNNSFTLYTFICLYLLGGYLKKYPLDKSYLFKKCSKQLFQVILVSIFMFCILINFNLYITAYSLKGVNSIFGEIFRIIDASVIFYNNPFVVIQTVAYFLFFSTLNIKSKLINLISSLTFGIYLIHENGFVIPLLYKKLRIDNGPIYSTRFIIYIFFITIVIFVVCAIIEFCRQQLFKFIRERNIAIKLREKFNKFCNTLKLQLD